MFKFKSILAVCLFFVSLSSYAVKPVLEAGLHFGGDTLYTASFTDGSTQTVEGGGLISLAAGAQFELVDSVDGVVTFGWKFDSITASNGSIDFNRYPVNALLLYKVDDQVRIGGGLTYHMSPKLDIDAPGLVGTVNYKDALGYILDARYLFSETAYFGGRFTSIEYESKNSGRVYDGSSFGLVIGVAFE